VRVIITIHNGEKFLGEAITSVLAQDYSPIELIVVDDGSTDASARLVKGFGSQLHYCYQPNAGTGAARNVGITLSLGDYLAFLDQDDVSEPHKLTWQIDVLTKSKIWDAVFGYAQQIRNSEVPGTNWRLFHLSQTKGLAFLHQGFC
jgi:glycosyltransferase involved in cell wall biosynthesis